MKAFFIGSLYPNERIDEFRMSSRGFRLDNAANNLQWALLNGIKHYIQNITVITQPNTRSFPFRNNTMVFKQSFFSHNSKSKDTCLGYINFPVLKHISRYQNLHKYLKKVIPQNEETLAFVYGMHSPFLHAVSGLKRSGWDKLNTCLIVPDLPQYMRETTNFIYRGLKNIDSYVINYNIKYFDSFVLLTDAMAERLKLQNKPWVRIEGITNPKEYPISGISDKTAGKKIVMYSGTLAMRYGILDLLNAFERIKDPDYELWMCGVGNAEKTIIYKAKTDKRIRFFGQLSRGEVLDLQQKSTVLINPRSSQGEYTKYSFPSKTMEYLLSGKPVIMRKLPGIPEEYHKHLFFAADNSIEALQKAIVEVCNKSDEELYSFGTDAKQFIYNDKNPKVQVGKIVRMIDALK